MSKLSQRMTAQDTIKANFMADTAEKEQLKKQLLEYEAILQSIRNLSLKQEENSELVTQILDKLEHVNGNVNEQDNTALLQEIKECMSRSDEFTHKECVKVYRNVQALLDEQNKKADENTAVLTAKMEDDKKEFYKELSDVKHIVDRAAFHAKEADKNAVSCKKWIIVTALATVINLVCMLWTLFV